MIEEKKNDEKNPFVIKLTEVASRDKEGKEIKDELGNLVYRQADAFAFNQILAVIDTANYDLDSLRILSKIQDRFEEAWKKEDKTIELTLDMVSFLKEFCKNHRGKLRKDASLNPFLTRSLISIADQVLEL